MKNENFARNSWLRSPIGSWQTTLLPPLTGMKNEVPILKRRSGIGAVIVVQYVERAIVNGECCERGDGCMEMFISSDC